jgi:hypothetical protein
MPFLVDRNFDLVRNKTCFISIVEGELIVTRGRELMFWFIATAFLVLSGCAAKAPASANDLCGIFDEKKKWHKQARRAEERWNVPIPVMMAIMNQESSFKAKAKPPRTRILWVLPGPRPSSAYGYSQAMSGTWNDYRQATGNSWARRDRFGDAVDFIGWYNHNSYRRCNIKPGDAYHLYLAYHDGHGGFNRRTYQNKEWLTRVARRVSAQADLYERQYDQCKDRLQRRWFFF